MSRGYPFRRPGLDVVVAGPWSRVVADGVEELPGELPDWDYETVLSLGRPVRVHGRRARRECGLPPEAALDLTVRWASSSSLLRGRAWRAEVPDRDDIDLTVEFDLPGLELGGNLELQTVLTLRHALGGSPIAPTRPGSVLWSDRRSVLLQGDAALFPIALVDFDVLPYPGGAAWYLDAGEDLDAAALGSVLLLVNDRIVPVRETVAAAADPDAAQQRILSVLRTDVIRTLCERALTHEDFDDRVEYPTGSLGALYAAVLRQAFPAADAEALRRERATQPALFTSRVQEATNLLAAP